MKAAAVFWPAVLNLAILSCSLEYDKLELSDAEKELIPDVRLRNLTERVYEDGERILEMQAEYLMTFESRGLQEIEGLRFRQYNGDGELVLEGAADYASRNLEYDDIVLRGNVSIVIHESDAEISGERFLYSGKQQLVWADDDDEVLLSRFDGSHLRGKGFVADLLTRELRFDGGTRGVFYLSDDGDRPE